MKNKQKGARAEGGAEGGEGKEKEKKKNKDS